MTQSVEHPAFGFGLGHNAGSWDRALHTVDRTSAEEQVQLLTNWDIT